MQHEWGNMWETSQANSVVGSHNVRVCSQKQWYQISALIPPLCECFGLLWHEWQVWVCPSHWTTIQGSICLRKYKQSKGNTGSSAAVQESHMSWFLIYKDCRGPWQSTAPASQRTEDMGLPESHDIGTKEFVFGRTHNLNRKKSAVRESLTTTLRKLFSFPHSKRQKTSPKTTTHLILAWIYSFSSFLEACLLSNGFLLTKAF